MTKKGDKKISISDCIFIIIYYLLITADLFTTWLASPDLKYEGNIIIKNLRLKWPQIIIITSIASLLISWAYLMSVGKIIKYFQETKQISVIKLKNIFNEKQLLLSFLGIWIFISHLLCSFFLPINNYLAYLYLSKNKNLLSEFTISYLEFKENFDPHFFKFAYFLLILLSFLLTWIKIKRYSSENRNQQILFF